MSPANLLKFKEQARSSALRRAASEFGGTPFETLYRRELAVRQLVAYLDRRARAEDGLRPACPPDLDGRSRPPTPLMSTYLRRSRNSHVWHTWAGGWACWQCHAWWQRGRAGACRMIRPLA